MPSPDTLQEKIREDRQRRWNEYEEVMREEALPPNCTNCKRPSTHVSDGVTPAGYHNYLCDRCAARANARAGKPLWGADPGWRNIYLSIEEATARWEEKHTP